MHDSYVKQNLYIIAVLFIAESNIDARLIVDGHREKTLSLLWKIIFHFQVSSRFLYILHEFCVSGYSSESKFSYFTLIIASFSFFIARIIAMPLVLLHLLYIPFHSVLAFRSLLFFYFMPQQTLHISLHSQI